MPTRARHAPDWRLLTWHACHVEWLAPAKLGQLLIWQLLRRLDEIIVFRQLTKGEVKEIADIMLREVFKRADTKGIKIDVTERFKVCQLPTQEYLLHSCKLSRISIMYFPGLLFRLSVESAPACVHQVEVYLAEVVLHGNC